MAIDKTQAHRPSPVRTAVKTVAAAGVATGAALYLAKTGKLDKFVGKNKTVDKGISGLKTAADKISTKLNPYIQKATEKFGPKIKDLKSKAEPIITSVKTKLQGVKKSVTEFVSKIVEKITPKAKVAAEQTVEAIF
ncbi:MAG: hypothetical protein E7Z90_01770 [Cyanobacteria bacterium SIG29]|nr:hypothetical protein [Cyanobacteria bacterium SIG29]